MNLSKVCKILFSSAALQVAGVLCGFTLTVILSRSLGASEFGIYSVAYSACVLLAIPVQAGLPTLVMRETARFDSENAPRRIRGLWQWATCLALAISLAIAFPAGLGAFYFGGIYASTLVVALALVPLMALSALRAASLKGLRHVIAGQVPDLVLRPLVLILLILIAMDLIDLSAPSAMGLHVVATGIAFLAGMFLLLRNLPDKVRVAKPDTGLRSDWLRMVVPMGTIMAAQVFSANIGIIVLGVVGTPYEAGLFRIAIMLGTLLMFGRTAIIAVVQPYLSRNHYSGDKDRLQFLAGAVSSFSLATAAPLVLFFFFFGDQIINWGFGTEYSGVWPVLMVISVGQLVNAFFASVGSVLMMAGQERATMRVITASTAISVLVYLVIVPFFGALGAAAAMAFNTTILHLGYWYVARQSLSIDCSAVSLLKRLQK